MKFDLNKVNIIYPSWIKLSYEWTGIRKMLLDPISTKYLNHRSDWFKIGYSKIVDNFELIDGPVGNGIITVDKSKIIDVANPSFWLPYVLLCKEAFFRGPPGIPIVTQYDYTVSYLSPKPSDEVRLGLEPARNDPMPYFSVEPSSCVMSGALLCISCAGSNTLIDDLYDIPNLFQTFGLNVTILKAVDAISLIKYNGINEFLKKWKLSGTWYSINNVKCDAGLLFAMVVYLGSYFRSKIGSRVKSCHLVMDLTGYPPICSSWTMHKLR